MEKRRNDVIGCRSVMCVLYIFLYYRMMMADVLCMCASSVFEEKWEMSGIFMAGERKVAAINI